MPSYVYAARDQRGTLQTGHLEAMDEDAVVAVLHNRGLIVTALSRKDAQAAARDGQDHAARRLHHRVTTDDQVLFCQQFAAMLEAGIPLLRSLEVLSAQVESRALLEAIGQPTELFGLQDW